MILSLTPPETQEKSIEKIHAAVGAQGLADEVGRRQDIHHLVHQKGGGTARQTGQDQLALP